jgi:hypothetical protein
MKSFGKIALSATVALAAFIGTAHAQAIMDGVKSKGFVQCGVNTGLRSPGQPGRLEGDRRRCLPGGGRRNFRRCH